MPQIIFGISWEPKSQVIFFDLLRLPVIKILEHLRCGRAIFYFPKVKRLDVEFLAVLVTIHFTRNYFELFSVTYHILYET